MAKALVTGCAGFIGSHLTDTLLASGHEVLGVDCFDDYYARTDKEANIEQARAAEEFELVEADLLDLASDGRLAELVDSADWVFHLAAQPGVRASWGATFESYTDNNVLATQRVLEAAKQVGVDAFVYASSSSVYGDTTVFPMREDAPVAPYSPYGVTKLAGEHLCRLYSRNFGLHTTSLRFFTVYGPRQRPDMAFRKFIEAALRDESIQVFGDGKQTRDFTCVSDIVEGLIGALHAPPGTVANLAGGSRVSLAEAIATLERVMDRPIRVDHVGEQAGDVRDTWASIEVAQEALGYAPHVGLEQGLAAEVAWLSQREGAAQ